MNLVGQNVILTGASFGIGRELFKLLIERDCNILTVSRDTEDDQVFQVVYPISTDTSFYENAKSPESPKSMQSSEKVAKAIIKGIEQDKEEIYPLKSFHFMKSFMRLRLKYILELKRRSLIDCLNKKS